MASRKTKSGSTNSPDKKLPLNKSIPLGIQHVLAMFAGNITVPIIVAGVFGKEPPLLQRREEFKSEEAREIWKKLISQVWRRTEEVWSK